jgi:hypothetical protein
MLVSGTPAYTMKKIAMKLYNNSCWHLWCYYRAQRNIGLLFIHVYQIKVINMPTDYLSKGYDVEM